MRRYLLLVAFLCIAGTTSVYAGGFGLQIDINKFVVGDDSTFDFQEGSDFGVGARGEFGTNTLALVLSFDYYFQEERIDISDLSFYEFNANLAFTFPTEGIRPYIGAGIGAARQTFELLPSFSDSEWENGFNILGGLKFGAGVINPFVEARYTIYGGDETFNNRFVLTAGLLF